MKLFWIGILFLIATNPNAKKAVLLDKTIAVIDDEVITLSQVRRIQKTFGARRNIVPHIYNRRATYRNIIDIKIDRTIIRKKLEEIGYGVSDDEVEKTIKDREKHLGINRKALIRFLKKNKLSYDEYSQLTRETIEFGRFNGGIIRPLVSVTDQDIKNAFYKENINNKTLSFRYELTGFSLARSKMRKGMLRNFKKAVADYQRSGILPIRLASLETNDLGHISEDGMERGLKKLLKSTDENELSNPYLKNGRYHIFHIKKKDIVESEIFQREKSRVQNTLLQNAIKETSATWLRSERDKHYIRYFN